MRLEGWSHWGGFSRGLMVRDARRRAPHHEGPRPIRGQPMITPIWAILKPVPVAAGRPGHHMRTVGQLEQMRCVLLWPLVFWRSPSSLLPAPQGCITPNRDMSSCVPAKVWTHAFRQSSRTRPRATTIHPGWVAA